MSEEPVFAYLARYGDAVQQRVDSSLIEAPDLLAKGHAGAALVRAASGIELAIRFFLVRPLVQGAFLSDQWAQTLVSRIVAGRGADDRVILPAILRNWKLDVATLKLSNGKPVWETVKATVWPRRNEWAHAGAQVSEAEAQLAIECLERLLSDVVAPIAERLGFTRVETGKWSLVLSSFDRSLNPPQRYETASPFP